MPKPNGTTQVYIRTVDRERLSRLCEHDKRSVAADELRVIIDEACQRRGLDPETVQPTKGSPAQTPEAA